MTPTINPLEVPVPIAESTSDEATVYKQVIAQQLLSAFEEIIAGGLGSQISLNMRTILLPCILTLLDRPGSTLLDLQRFMDDNRNGDLVSLGLTRTHYPALPSFFAGQFQETKSYLATKSSIATKLQDLFNTGIFVDLTCGKSTIDLEQEINQHKIILVNLASGVIGDAASQSFGRLLMAQLQSIALRRASIPKEERVRTHVIVDECQNFITPSVRKILLKGRKFRFHLTLCQQIIGEGMSASMREVITGSCNVQFSGYAQPEHQAAAARLMQVEPSDISRLRKGNFYLRVGRHKAFKLRVRSDLVDTSHSVQAALWEREARHQLATYYRPKRPPEKPQAAPPKDPPPGRNGRGKKVFI